MLFEKCFGINVHMYVHIMSIHTLNDIKQYACMHLSTTGQPEDVSEYYHMLSISKNW